MQYIIELSTLPIISLVQAKQSLTKQKPDLTVTALFYNLI